MSNGNTLVDFSAGMQVGPDERYEIVRICGRGGMGVVYEAVDHGLDRPRKVALKQLNKVFSQDPRSVKSIRQEAGNARELRHQNIMGVFDYVSWRDEHLVIMEWISGKTLAQDLFDQPNNRYSPDQALKLLKPIAAALDYAHKLKPPVVHRDLKPLNVMLTEDGDVKVTDFGLSREVKESVTRVTGKDSSGSLEYMPFEQYMGDPPAPVHDIYALGITAYELLNGQPPFTRGDLGLQHKDKIPPTITDIPKPLMAILLKCLSKDEKERYSSASEFIESLDPDPFNVSAYNNMGATYYDQENYTEAIKCYKKAIELDPDHIPSYNNIAETYLAQDNNTEAIKCYKKAIEIDPDDSDAYFNIGYSYKEVDNHVESLKWYKKAAKLGDQDAQELLNERESEG